MMRFLQEYAKNKDTQAPTGYGTYPYDTFVGLNIRSLPTQTITFMMKNARSGATAPTMKRMWSSLWKTVRI